MGSLIWINGPFGVGKTTTAEIVCERAGGLFFDPEELGFLLRDIVPKKHQSENFQDIPLWRTALIHFAHGLCNDYTPPVVMPMTIYNSIYVKEIMDSFGERGVNLFHVVLTASREIIAHRIGDRQFGESAAAFSLHHLDASLLALNQVRTDLLIDNSAITAHDCAQQILQALPNGKR